MARTASAPLVSFIPALPRSGYVTDAGRSYFFAVTPGEGVTLRSQVEAGALGARLPLNSKPALRSAVLAAYRAAQATATGAL